MLVTTRCDGLFRYIDFCLFPLPTVGDYVSSGSLYLSDARQTYSRRLTSPEIDVWLPQKWLKLCQEEHGEACEHPQWRGTLEYPVNLRVIDVATMSLTTAPPECRYITLSYVWGDVNKLQPFQTSKRTIEGFSQLGGLRFERLPKTISDAMRLVKAVGERYLWIDSLCIIQDDDFDKASYISQMDLIYACSLYTIVAAVGENCDAGLPGLFGSPRTFEQQFVQVDTDLGLITERLDGYNQSKWSRRGWTYQELQLSRRALIFYEDRMMWNCECDFWDEIMCFEPSAPASTPCFDKMGVSLGFCTPVPRFDLHSLGNHIFHYNTGRDFTNEGDAFDAFRGVLSRIEKVTGISFYWGLPCEHFHHLLLWRDSHTGGWREDLPRLSPCTIFNDDCSSHSIRIPSWSWLGWYTRLHRLFYPGEKPPDINRFYQPTKTDWAAKWLRIDLDGHVSEIGKQNQDLSLLLIPSWAGTPITSTMSLADGVKDYGRIAAYTSFNSLRLRTHILDIQARRKGTPPRDGNRFELLDKTTFEPIGTLFAKDQLRTARKFDSEEEIQEFKRKVLFMTS